MPWTKTAPKEVKLVLLTHFWVQSGWQGLATCVPVLRLVPCRRLHPKRWSLYYLHTFECSLAGRVGHMCACVAACPLSKTASKEVSLYYLHTFECGLAGRVGHMCACTVARPWSAACWVRSSQEGWPHVCLCCSSSLTGSLELNTCLKDWSL